MTKMTSKNVIVKTISNCAETILCAILMVALIFCASVICPSYAVEDGVFEMNAYAIMLLSVLIFASILCSFIIVKQAFIIVCDEIEYCRETLENLKKNHGDF